ncbi:MAG TPA: DUF4149 domain-containing protein [Thermoanaerobaculia bacterium]|nr:DUF4149 domain-containing protein [Thermoanaerobaculia bacterium]
MRAFRNLILALWLGGGAALIAIAAPAAFKAAPTPTAAADVVGAMLARWHYLEILAPVIVLAIELIRSRPRQGIRIVLLAAAVLLGSIQIGLDLQIRSIRENSPIPISLLSRDHPTRRRFGLFHGLSSLAMLLQVVTAAGVVVAEEEQSPT